jgi:hypothetical protein
MSCAIDYASARIGVGTAENAAREPKLPRELVETRGIEPLTS